MVFIQAKRHIESGALNVRIKKGCSPNAMLDLVKDTTLAMFYIHHLQARLICSKLRQMITNFSIKTELGIWMHNLLTWKTNLIWHVLLIANYQMCKSFPTFDTLKMVQFGEVLTCLNHYLYPKSGFQNWGGTIITNFQLNDLPTYLCLCACLRVM